jgi:hypothetical protein
MTIILEHAAIFKDMLGKHQPEDVDKALLVMNKVICTLLKGETTPELNRRVFICLGGTINHVHANKQDQTSPLIEYWEWGGGGIPYYKDFLHHPLGLIQWLEKFPDIDWRLSRIANTYGVKVYRTIHTHSDPTVALAIACVHYAKRLVEIIKDE